MHTAFEPIQADRMQLPPESWKRLGDAFSAHGLRETYSRAIEFERAQGVDVVRNREGLFRSSSNLGYSFLLKKAGTNHLQLLTRAVELSRLPFPEARQEEEALLQALRARRSPLHILSAMLLPDLRSAHANMAACETRLLIARTVCALKAAGIYPPQLELPDPITGKTLHYRREGEGFLLYSPGVDGIDDHGVNDGGKKDDIGVRVLK